MTLLEILENHYIRYPKMEIQDFYKLVFQHTFGPEHAIHDVQESYEILKQEVESLNHTIKVPFEDIGNHYVRYHLNPFDELPISIIHKMFVYSAQQIDIPKAEYYKHIDILQSFCLKHNLAFSLSNDNVKPLPVSHSDTYKKAYDPHYRVLNKEFQIYYPLILEIVKRIKHDENIVLTIDGMCGSGKTTLANMLSYLFDASIVHMDDFFLQPHQRKNERLKEIGGFFDYERFEKEIIMELVPCHDFQYQPFDCQQAKLIDTISIHRKSPLLIIEGVYSQHPRLRYKNHLSVFLETSQQEQRQRIKQRNPVRYSRFIEEWIPREESYFETFQIKQNANICIYNCD